MSKISKLLTRLFEDQESDLHRQLDQLELEYDKFRDKELTDSEDRRKQELSKKIDQIHSQLQIIQKNKKRA